MTVSYQTKRAHSRARGSETRSRGSVQVQGENVFYEASGLAEWGPTILFLHESGGSSATWHEQLSGLATVARCLVPDLPGHGRSEGTGRPSIEAYCDSVLGFLDALAVRWSVVVAGVCLGAAIATELARRAPERVAGLILCGCADGGRVCENTLKAAEQGEARETFVHELFSEGVSSRLLNQRLQQWLKTNPSVRHGDLLAIKRYAFNQSLQTVQQPKLLISGQCDPVLPPAVSAALSARLTDARHITIEGAGCLAMLERPGLFNRAVTEHLERSGHTGPMDRTPRSAGGYRRH